MKLKISIDLNNAAFQDDGHGVTGSSEAARILRKLADDIEAGGLPGMVDFALRDINGNTVGHAQRRGK